MKGKIVWLVMCIIIVLSLNAVKLSAIEKKTLLQNPKIEMQEINENTREYSVGFRIAATTFKHQKGYWPSLYIDVTIKGYYLWGKIINVKGIKEILISPYAVKIEKDELIPWEKIEQRITQLIIEASKIIC